MWMNGLDQTDECHHHQKPPDAPSVSADILRMVRAHKEQDEKEGEHCRPVQDKCGRAHHDHPDERDAGVQFLQAALQALTPLSSASLI